MRNSNGPGQALPTLRDVGEDDGDVYVVGVRESTDPQAWSLMFMEPYEPGDEQEIALGMDTYCLVVDPGQATHYGGVHECELTESGLRLVLADDAAAVLGIPAEAHFGVELTPDRRELLARGLRRVLTSGRANAVPQLLGV